MMMMPSRSSAAITINARKSEKNTQQLGHLLLHTRNATAQVLAAAVKSSRQPTTSRGSHRYLFGLGSQTPKELAPARSKIRTLRR